MRRYGWRASGRNVDRPYRSEMRYIRVPRSYRNDALRTHLIPDCAYATHAGPNTYSSPAGFILEGRARGTKLACPVRSPPEMSLPFNHPASLLFGSTEPSARKGPPIFSLTWRGRETTEIIGGKSSRGTRDTIVFPATCHYLRVRFILHIRVCIIRH